MSRQIGVALGVAVLMSLLGSSGHAYELSRFQAGWAFMAAAAVAAAVVLGSLGRGKPAAAPVPASVRPEPAL